VLSTIVWDIGRFGIQVVASPRHADDSLYRTVTENMRVALKKPMTRSLAQACYRLRRMRHKRRAVPHFYPSARRRGLAVPVDLYIPGMPAASANDLAWVIEVDWESVARISIPGFSINMAFGIIRPIHRVLSDIFTDKIQ